MLLLRLVLWALAAVGFVVLLVVAFLVGRWTAGGEEAAPAPAQASAPAAPGGMLRLLGGVLAGLAVSVAFALVLLAWFARYARVAPRLEEFRARLARALSVELPRDAKMTDVPCHSWFLPTMLKNAGVEFLHLGSNAMSSGPGGVWNESHSDANGIAPSTHTIRSR